MANHQTEPLSSLDYYAKSNVSKYILQKSAATISLWEKEGKVFAPRFLKSPQDPNARKYYSLADAMRISIMVYGAIHMDKIYALGLSKILDDEDIVNPSAILLTDSGIVKSFKRDIKNSFTIVKNQIINKSTDPVDLSPYLSQEEMNG